MSQTLPRSLRSQAIRRRRRSRSNSPFGDEDIPVTHSGHSLYDHIETRMNCPKITAFTYDEKMLLHRNIWDNLYFERPERLRSCYERICELNLLDSCITVEAKEIQTDILCLIHSQSHVQLIDNTQNMTLAQLQELSSQHDCVFFDTDTRLAASISAGATIEVLKTVLDDRAKNGFCLIRPPGHHAMESEASGFCIYNNVGIAAKYAISKYSLQKILIVDWDVHHGNATQYQFYDTNKVLYISIHRYEEATFWPKLKESNYDYIGVNSGKGYNINIPLNKTNMTNSDYLAIFHNIILPVSYEFNPDLVLVSAGYDSAIGCPEGGMDVHPACFAHMTHKLMNLARGRLVVLLEGGYCLESLSESVSLTLATLIGKPPPKLEDLDEPSDCTKETIHNCLKFIKYFWKSLSIYSVESQEPYPQYLLNLPLSTWNLEKEPCLPIEINTGKNCQNTEVLHKILELQNKNVINRYPNKTCFVYDCRMENHRNERSNHPESPRRTQLIYEFLRDNNLLNGCKRLETRQATKEELCFIHSNEYINNLENICNESPEIYYRYEESLNSIYINQHSYSSALLSCGLLLNVVDEICLGKSENGFSITRPPGHHAEFSCPMGFCFFNNVAIATKYALSKYADSIKKILIVDWDVHHGNGTQHQFWTSNEVLYISLHRYDNGQFFPSTNEGSPSHVGESNGEGFNVNIAWNRRPIRDAEYMSAFINIIMPIGHEFNPDLVIVSSGFDATRGDPIGGLTVTPECYGHMTQMLTGLANGKVILCLEGGYNLNAITECMSHCVSSLLGFPTIPLNNFLPNKNGIEAIRKTIEYHKPYWKCFKFHEPLLIYTETNIAKLNTTISNGQEISSVTLTDAMCQLAIVEIISQTEQSNEEPLTQIQSNILSSEPVTSNLVIHPQDFQIPSTEGPTSAASNQTQLVQGGVSANLSLIDHSSGANPVNSNISTVFNEGNSVGLVLQDLMNLSGVTNSDIHNFLGLTMNNPLPEIVYAVQPLAWCEHLSQVHDTPPASEIDVNALCSICSSNQENWLCLTCYQVHCSCFVQGHMMQHFRNTGHSLVLSFVDLSSWCYECDSYIHNECLTNVKREAHIAKFGVPPPNSSR